MNDSLHKFQKALYLQVKKKARIYQGEASKDLKHYRSNFKKQTSVDFELTRAKDLLQSLKSSQVVYLGDFHTFDQGSKNLERILKALTSKSNFILTLEFISTLKQSSIDNYLAGHITEFEFLEEIGYTESWKFPWTHYKRFFTLAKTHNLKIVGLNSKGTLEQRDIHAGQIISELIKENPKAKVLCIFGEYHIVPNKLPKLVGRLLSNNVKQTIIYQNCDDVFWKLSDAKELEKGAVIKFSDNQYSIQTSPPWIKYESLIYWYENLLDDPHFDIHQYILEKGFLVSSQGSHEQFLSFFTYFADYLNIKINQDEIEDFNFIDYQGIDTILDKVNEISPNKLRPLYNSYLKQGKSFFIPHSNIYYTPRHSINKIAQLVGIHLLRGWRNEHDLDSLDSMIRKYNPSDIFNYFLIHSSFTYIVSKIINPYRKCDLYGNLYEVATYFPKTPKAKVYKLSLKLFDYLEKNKKPTLFINKLSLQEIDSLAKIVGKILGENLFDKLKGQKQPEKLLKKIYLVETKDFDFFSLAHKILPKNFHGQKKRFF